MGQKLKIAGWISVGALAGALTTVSLQTVARGGLAPLPLEELQQLAAVFGMIKSDYVEPVDEKKLITEAIAGLRKAMEGDDPAAIETATQTLTTASHKLAEEMYKKASAAAGAGAAEAGASTGDAGAQAKTDEKVVDAEFEEVDKDKK